MKIKRVLRHCDLDLRPKVTKFNRVRASARSNHLAKTASKSVHPFVWNFVHKKCRTHRQTDRQTYTQTDTQTNCSENITPPRFHGGVKIDILWHNHNGSIPFEQLMLLIWHVLHNFILPKLSANHLQQSYLAFTFMHSFSSIFILSVYFYKLCYKENMI